MTLLSAWIIWALCGVAIYSAAFVWAVRSRQFSDLEKPRYIALDSDRFIEEDTGRVPGRIDRYTGVGLFTLLFIAVVVTLWLGMRSN